MHQSKREAAAFLNLPRSTLYYQPKLPAKDELLRQRVIRVMQLHPSYGHRRLALALGVNKKRVLRVMHVYGIQPYRRRGKRPKREASLATGTLPNLLQGYFPNDPGEVWVTDFTYLPYQGRFIYLATVMDLYSREVVGWAVSGRHDTALVAGALFDALLWHGPPRIAHSDQGNEYTAQIYRELAERCGIRLSFSAKASPWQNGYQESFYSQFKVDLGDPHRFSSVGELVEAIHLTIFIYNHYRIHTALRMAPLQYLR